MKLTKFRGLWYILIIIAMLNISKQFLYRTVPIVEVDTTTNEIVIEYHDNLYAAYVEDARDWQVGEEVKVLMKSSTCWDFELNPLLDEIQDIK